MGTVFVKHFDLVTDFSDPKLRTAASRRASSARSNGSVYGVTYKWRPDNSDADLLTNFLNEPITITNADHTTWTQTLVLPQSHRLSHLPTPAANYVLGVKTRQLITTLVTRPVSLMNQLRTLNHIGLFNPAFNESSISGYSHLSS
jgi:hypothetical protein